MCHNLCLCHVYERMCARKKNCKCSSSDQCKVVQENFCISRETVKNKNQVGCVMCCQVHCKKCFRYEEKKLLCIETIKKKKLFRKKKNSSDENIYSPYRLQIVIKTKKKIIEYCRGCGIVYCNLKHAKEKN